MKQTNFSNLGKLLLIITIAGLFSIQAAHDAVAKPVASGFLGVNIRDISSTLEKQLGIEGGAVVTWVEEDSPAGKAGILEDDVIIQVNDKMIKKSTTLSRIIRRMNPGDKAKVTLYRDGKKKVAEVTIGESPKPQKHTMKLNDNRKVIKMMTGSAYMGVELQNLNDDLAPYFSVKPTDGVLVTEVKNDSPAAKSGLKAGDVLTKVAGETVASAEDVIEILSEYEADDEVSVDFIRQKDQQSTKVILAERDDQNIFLSKGFPHQKMMHMQIQGDDEDMDMPCIPEQMPGKQIRIEKKIHTTDGFI
ncbi:PDZ domain-containing protein [candidate division KSB1 bacterium]|nr:PDZ domain-containing protein [candidate division KSB1 bacterium]